MDIKLTTGAVSTLMRGEDVDKPVFQILGFKRISGQQGSDRFRLNISDGLHSHTFAMLATQLNVMIPSGELDNNCVVRVEKLISNAVSEKRVLIILELTVLAKGADIGQRLGNPVQYTEQNANMAGTGGATNGNSSAAPAPRATFNAPPVKTEISSKQPTSFYGQDQKKRSPEQKPTPAANRNNTSIGNTTITDAVVPIRDITPYNSKCTIKARVTNKSTIRTWSNSRGDGKLFSVDLLDESGEIRATGFNNAVDQFYEILKVNQVYVISKFSAKPANKQFTTLNHDYEISFTNDSQVMPCFDEDNAEIPTLAFSFTEIAFIDECEKDKIIDVIGVCKRRGDVQTIMTRKDNKEMKKRDITLVDRTNTEVALTLWGKQAEDFEDDSNPVVAVKGAKVGDFNGKNLSLLMSSVMLMNPDIQESHVLRGWYDNEGMNAESKSLGGQRGGGAGANAPWKMIREANSDPTSAEAGYYFKSKVTVLAMKRENALYKACPEEKCNKKVTDIGNGLYRCEKCNKEVPEFKWRLIVTTCFGDCSDSVWATCFQEQGELLLNTKTDQLGSFHTDEPDTFDAIVKQAVFKNYTAKFRAKMETYNNENRLKYVVMELQPINFSEYAQKLVAEIKENMA